LKELKLHNSNEKHSKQVTLQSDMVQEWLKSTNGHVSQNVLKRRQSFINHTPITLTLFWSPSLSHNPPLNELDGPSICVDSPNLIPLTTLVKMQGFKIKINKGEITSMNLKNMATITSWFSSMFNVCDAFLLKKMNVNCERNNKIKINNLKMVKGIFVI